MKFRYFLQQLLIAAPLTVLAATGAHAEDAGTIMPDKLLVGVDANQKPNVYIDNGQITGFDAELLRAMGKKLGLTVEFRAQDLSVLLPSVSSGQVDIAASSISITPDRLKMVDFSEGYLVGFVSVATLPDSTISKDPASVRGKRIGVIQGTIEDTYASQYLPGAQIVRFPNLNAGFLSLRSKYIDGYFVDDSNVTAFKQQYPQLNLSDRIDISVVNLPVGFPMRKGNTKLKLALDKALAEIVADGTWFKVYREFYPDYPNPDKLPPYQMKTSG